MPISGEEGLVYLVASESEEETCYGICFLDLDFEAILDMEAD